jgi:hypothetical protein
MIMRPGAAVIEIERPAPRPADASTWFEAATERGPLHLNLPAAARHAADAAIALHRCETLIAGLELWARRDLDWRWTAPPARESQCDGTQVLLHWRAAEARLICPWAWLRALPPPDDAWAADLHWPALAATLTIEQLRLSADELGALEPGGAIVLPSSMRPGWQGRLRSADEAADAGIAVELMPPIAARLVPQAAAEVTSFGEAGGTPCEIRLDLLQAVSADRLTGWRGDPLPPVGPGAGLWRADGAAELARGRLMPWGDGWALCIEALGPA